MIYIYVYDYIVLQTLAVVILSAAQDGGLRDYRLGCVTQLKVST